MLFTGGAAMEQNVLRTSWPTTRSWSGTAARSRRRNAFRAGWVNNFDLRISQELPGFFKGHKSELWLDIMNVGNLINKDWGRSTTTASSPTRRVANYVGIDPATGKYVYGFTGSTDNPAIQATNNDKGNNGVSHWSVQLGFKYKF